MGFSCINIFSIVIFGLAIQNLALDGGSTDYIWARTKELTKKRTRKSILIRKCHACMGSNMAMK